ncbi:MAG: argininosuccinate lyase [Lactobacillus delbrueckii]|jgi:argininosuccinate lyase|nr:argininosuccinate lyase [Lactobacillus delbrueckii]
MKKMWAGRTSGKTDQIADDFNSSIRFDQRMYPEDIAGSIAHAKMLAKQGIIPKEASAKIIAGLEGILADLNSGKLEIDPAAEDIHMFIEETLTDRIGQDGKMLHTARSRNDQVALDIRLYMREENGQIKQLLKDLVAALCDQAEKYKASLMPGYTHLQRAQPVTFGHQLMAYAYMFMRDLERLGQMEERMNYSPIGSCALAGTTYPIDRVYEAELLGFKAPVANSLDGVSDRDHVVEDLSDLALVMMHLSRLSEELILWSSWEFHFVHLADAYTTGSSIMPQKKNPDMAELARGKTGRVYGDLMAILTTLKGLPLAYNKDMQEDKEALFDAIDNVELCLETFIPMIKTLEANEKSMHQAAQKGFINATDLADYLTKKGMPFRDAYHISGQLVALCIDQDTVLEDLPLETYKGYSDLFEEDLYQAIDLHNCLAKRTSLGGPTPESVQKQVDEVRGKLAEEN